MPGHWLFHDPVSGDYYAPPIGPDRMTTPFPQRALTDQGTASRAAGKVLTWEGASDLVVDWQFSGTLLEKAHYDALKLWVAKPYRTLVTDYLNRVWEVKLRTFAPTPRRVLDYPWAHTYVVTATIFGRHA